VAYQADIVIAVKGATQLTNLQRQIETTAASINKVNAQLASQGLLSNSISNLQKVVSQSSQAMRSATTGTTAQKQAIDIYVKSLAQAEKAEQSLAAAIKKRQQELGVATTKTTQASGGGGAGRIGSALSNAAIGGAFPLLFGQGAGAATGGAIGGLVGGAFGGIGGFAGSLVGTLIGDIASQGQAIQQLAEDIGFSAEQTDRLSVAFKTANTDVEKFTALIQNIRGIGLEIEDQAKAIELVTRLTELYGGSFEKTGNAITSALESGKVTQATLNQLTSQGITVQDALAAKYDVSRDAIIQMAKDGDISVQDLINTLVQLGNEGETAAKKPKSAFEQFTTALGNTGAAVANLAAQIGKTLGPALDAILIKATTVLNAINQALAAGSISMQQKQAAKGRAENIVRGQAGFLPGGPFGAGGITVKYGQKTYKGAASSVVSQITNDLINAEVQKAVGATAVKQPPLQTFTAPSQAVPSGGGGGKKASDKAADDEARMQARLQGLAIETNAIQKQLAIREKITHAEIAGDKQLEIRLQGEERNQQIITDLQSALVGVTDERERQALIAKTAAELDAAQLQTANELAKLENDKRKAVQDVLSGLDMEIVKLKATTEVEKQALQFLEIENQLKKQGITLTDQQAEAIRRALTQIQQLTKEQKAANAQLQMEKELFDGISGTVASTFSSALDAAVQGTENFGDALKDLGADLLATIGNMLIMYAIAQALGALGGGDSTGIISYLAMAFGYKPAKEGAYWPGGFEAFAEGGVVTSPTMGLIGEGGEPEYVIPASKMRGAMSRYASGARGSSVIPSSGETGTTQGSSSGVATAIDVRYSVERINSVDYVTADQFQAGMQQAAAQGAIQGEQLAMRKLQQSASTRNRLGLK